MSIFSRPGLNLGVSLAILVAATHFVSQPVQAVNMPQAAQTSQVNASAQISPRIQSLFALPLGTLGQSEQALPKGAPFVKCTKDGICELHGKVKIVKSGAKYKIKIVTSFPDIKVQKVSSFPNSAGKWQFVDSFPDFTVQIVTSFPDFTVQYVSSFPGC